MGIVRRLAQAARLEAGLQMQALMHIIGSIAWVTLAGWIQDMMSVSVLSICE
jgi:hypothetical protein